MISILDAMAAELGQRREWGEPPALYFAFDGEDGLHLVRLPVPDDAWAIDAPPVVLRWLAREFAASGLPALAPAALRAVAIPFEAWTVAGPLEDAAYREAAQQDARDRMLHARPDRVEVRMMLAAGRDGATHMVTERRDGVPVPPATTASGSADALGGSVPESLARIIAAIGRHAS